MYNHTIECSYPHHAFLGKLGFVKRTIQHRSKILSWSDIAEIEDYLNHPQIETSYTFVRVIDDANS